MLKYPGSFDYLISFPCVAAADVAKSCRIFLTLPCSQGFAVCKIRVRVCESSAKLRTAADQGCGFAGGLSKNAEHARYYRGNLDRIRLFRNEPNSSQC